MPRLIASKRRCASFSRSSTNLIAASPVIGPLLIATARAIGATLLTRDAGILAYGREGHVRVLDAGR